MFHFDLSRYDRYREGSMFQVNTTSSYRVRRWVVSIGSISQKLLAHTKCRRGDILRDLCRDTICDQHPCLEGAIMAHGSYDACRIALSGCRSGIVGVPFHIQGRKVSEPLTGDELPYVIGTVVLDIAAPIQSYRPRPSLSFPIRVYTVCGFDVLR